MATVVRFAFKYWSVLVYDKVKSDVSLREAARRLGMNYTTLRYKAVNLGLHKPKTKNAKNGKATLQKAIQHLKANRT